MENLLKIDCHTHCLPHMDDGAKDTKMALEMLKELSRQQVETVVLTPHYYASAEPVSDFLKRRDRIYHRLKDEAGIPQLRLGAEVYLERDINQEDVSSLCIEGTDRLLVELPFLPLNSWVIEEIENMYFSGGCKPILAHLTRYLPYFDDGAFDELIRLPEVAVQINLDSLCNRKSRKYVYQWIEQGVPIIFGSDCHNMKDRRPDFKRTARRVSKTHHGICLADVGNETAKELKLL